MTAHSEHAKRAGVSTPCTAHHVNFGGGCLNCGWMPDGGPRPPATHAQIAALTAERDAALAREKGLREALMRAITQSGFHVSGPTDPRVGQDEGEPTWVALARLALAAGDAAGKGAGA